MSQDQKGAALRLARSMGDRRLHVLRHEIISAIRDNQNDGGDKEAFQQQLMKRLQMHTGEMRQLRDEFFPDTMGGPADRGLPLDLDTLAKTRLVRLFQSRTALKTSDGVERKLQADMLMDNILEMWTEFKVQLAAMFQGAFGSSALPPVEAQEEGTLTCLRHATGPDVTVADCLNAAFDSMSTYFGKSALGVMV